MIGDFAYLVISEPTYYRQPIVMPMIGDNGKMTEIKPTDIYYFGPDYSYNYVTIISLDTQDDNEKYNSKTYLSGSTQNIFVSDENIYVTYTKYNDIYTI